MIKLEGVSFGWSLYIQTVRLLIKPLEWIGNLAGDIRMHTYNVRDYHCNCKTCNGKYRRN